MKILISLFLIFATCFSFGVETATSNAGEVIVSTNNAQFFCRTFGKGDPIIIIHGGPGLTHEYLLPAMAEFAETNFVIFYDQRGCGHSTGEINADAIQIDTFLDDLEAIRNSFGYKKWTVIGHSWGGFLAMHYAISHPEAIQKLILLDALPPSSEEISLFLQEYTKRIAPYQDKLKAIQETKEFVKGDPATFEKYYQIVFGRYCNNPEKALLLNLWMTPKASIDGLKVNKIFRENVFSKQFNLHNQLKQVKVPTLIIHGDFDPIPPCTAQKVHESIGGSKFILIKNCGHFPYVETPNEFFKYLNDFLANPA